MKTALMHDYFFQAGGAERVMETLHAMFPAAPIHTTIVRAETLWPGLRTADIRPVPWLQALSGTGIGPRALLPLYRHAVERLDLTPYDLVISNSSAFAKSVRVRPDAVHVCYCHSPMRFAWNSERYLERERVPGVARLALSPLLANLRRWDYRTRHRPSVYLANSSAVRARIRRAYGIDSEVVFPPVDTTRYRADSDRDDFALIVSRLAPYKRIDRAVEAFNRLRRPLVIIGDGPDAEALRAMAGPMVRLLGRRSDAEVVEYMARASLFIVPGEEDFGITPLEANAAGCPVVALRAGGAIDTVRDGESGVLFAEETADALAAAVRRADEIAWDVNVLRAHAAQFSIPSFANRFYRAVVLAVARATDGLLPIPPAPHTASA